MLYSPSDDSGSAGNPKGKRFLTEVVKSPDFTSILYSYQKSIVLGCGLFPLVIVASSGGIGLFGLIKKARSALFPKVSSKVLIILTHIASLWCFRTNVPLFSASSQESNFQRLHGKKISLGRCVNYLKRLCVEDSGHYPQISYFFHRQLYPLLRWR